MKQHKAAALHTNDGDYKDKSCPNAIDGLGSHYIEDKKQFGAELEAQAETQGAKWRDL